MLVPGHVKRSRALSFAQNRRSRGLIVKKDEDELLENETRKTKLPKEESAIYGSGVKITKEVPVTRSLPDAINNILKQKESKFDFVTPITFTKKMRRKRSKKVYRCLPYTREDQKDTMLDVPIDPSITEVATKDMTSDNRDMTPDERDMTTQREHFVSTIPQSGGKKYPQKRCVICRKHGNPRDTRYWCKECDVALCKQGCFAEFHCNN